MALLDLTPISHIPLWLKSVAGPEAKNQACLVGIEEAWACALGIVTNLSLRAEAHSCFAEGQSGALEKEAIPRNPQPGCVLPLCQEGRGVCCVHVCDGSWPLRAQDLGCPAF